MVIDRCSAGNDKTALSKCETILRGLKVDPFQFPAYIEKMQERYINYLVRTYRLYYVELVISHDRTLLLLLIDELRRQRRDREMHYFVAKYNFDKQLGFHYN
jgi:hypothetical protein